MCLRSSRSEKRIRLLVLDDAILYGFVRVTGSRILAASVGFSFYINRSWRYHCSSLTSGRRHGASDSSGPVRRADRVGLDGKIPR